jgi:hypothetical protein
MAKNDDTIKNLLAKVEAQQLALGAKPRPAWRTNGIFKYDGTNHFNLNTVAEPKPLVEATAFLIGAKKNLAEACTMLHVPEIEFKWNGYTYPEWLEDFKTRLSIVDWEAKKKQLEATKAKLSTLVSEEARTEMELEAITKSLE